MIWLKVAAFKEKRLTPIPIMVIHNSRSWHGSLAGIGNKNFFFVYESAKNWSIISAIIATIEVAECYPNITVVAQEGQ